MIARALLALFRQPGILAVRAALTFASMNVREETGANRGRWVDAIVELGGGDDEAAPAWCMLFCWACWHIAALALGLEVTSRTSGSVVSSWHRATDAERVTGNPRAGDLLLRVRDAEDLATVRAGGWCPGHAEIVVRCDDAGKLVTVGGNTFDEDGAEGDGVYIHRSTYTMNDDRIIGFIRPSVKRCGS
jgi:hypothetical protein